MRQYEFVMVKTDARLTVDGRDHPAMAKHALSVIPDDGREGLVVYALDPHGKPVGYEMLARGSVDHVSGESRDILSWGLQTPLARYLAIVHNHPSGVVTPSDADRAATRALAAACRLVGLDLLWHMVITHRSEEWALVPLERAPQTDGDDQRPSEPPSEGEGEDSEESEEPEEFGIEAPDGQTEGEGYEGHTMVSEAEVRESLRKLLGV